MAKDNVLADFHWMMDVLQCIDVGLIILDEGYNIHLWNSFMQNHSAYLPSDILGKNLFDSFPDLPEAWFRRKAETVFSLHNSAFTTWEQRPYLFRFKDYRPITGVADFMYQNSTIIPLKDARSNVKHICLIIYDVTEVAINRLQSQDANAKLQHLSSIDGLTGLLNRQTWETELDLEFKRFARHKHQASLIIFDIDHFKNVNDVYGHTAGDEVIRQVAKITLECLRNIDIAGRYGGEEFAIVLSETDPNGAQVVAERIRKKIEALEIIYDGQRIKFTISLGIAGISTQCMTPTQWIDLADKALYQAKHNGRNNSVIFNG